MTSERSCTRVRLRSWRSERADLDECAGALSETEGSLRGEQRHHELGKCRETKRGKLVGVRGSGEAELTFVFAASSRSAGQLQPKSENEWQKVAEIASMRTHLMRSLPELLYPDECWLAMIGPKTEAPYHVVTGITNNEELDGFNNIAMVRPVQRRLSFCRAAELSVFLMAVSAALLVLLALSAVAYANLCAYCEIERTTTIPPGGNVTTCIIILQTRFDLF